MKAGVRNKIRAEVIEIKKGGVMCQVKVKLKDAPKLQMSSVMTLESLEDLGLKKGETVEVLVKAVNVMLAKD